MKIKAAKREIVNDDHLHFEGEIDDAGLAALARLLVDFEFSQQSHGHGHHATEVATCPTKESA